MFSSLKGKVGVGKHVSKKSLWLWELACENQEYSREELPSPSHPNTETIESFF